MRWMLLALFLWSCEGAVALDTAARAAGDPDVERVLGRDPIVVEAGGRVPIPYANAVRMFASSNLLADVQREYARLLPPGEEPEFVITQRDATNYHYVNRSGQETHIREAHRAEHEGPTTEVVFFATGRRFFGDFESVIHIAAAPQGEETVYRVRVYAYPKNSVSRFFARHLRLVNLFFRSKTAEIQELSIRICQALGRTDVAAGQGPTPDRL